MIIMIKVHKARIEIGQCPFKGQVDLAPGGKRYCDGEDVGMACLAKYLFYGLAATTGGGRHYVAKSKGPCPDYSELKIPLKGKDEYVGLVDGGKLEGFKSGKAGPCLFFEVISHNEELLQHLQSIAALTIKPDAEGEIANYLKEHFGAPDDVREKARLVDMNSNAPKGATPQIEGYEKHLVQKACSLS